MTEIVVTTPDDTHIDQQQYSNGALHVYEVDSEGKKTHISHDSAIEGMGYDPNMDRDAPMSEEAQAKFDTAEEVGGTAVKEALGESKEPLKVGDIVQIYIDVKPGEETGESRLSQGWTIERIEEANPSDDYPDKMVYLRPPDGEEPLGKGIPLKKLENWQNYEAEAPEPTDPDKKEVDEKLTHEELLEEVKKLRTELEELKAGKIPEAKKEEAPKGPSPQEIEAAEANLVNARDELAAIDIRRSARTGDGLTEARKADGEAYKAALEKYREALAVVGKLRVAEMRAEGKTDAEIRQSLIQARYQESRNYTQKVFDKNNDELDKLEKEGGFFARNRAKLLRRWANTSTKKKILIGLAVGGGVSLASALSGGGIALLVAGSASRFSLGLLNRQASLRNVSKHSFDKEMKAIDATEQGHRDGIGVMLTGEEQAQRHAEGVAGEISNKTEKNQRKNRVGTALMVGGGVMAAAGIAHAEGLPLPDIGWPFGHSGGSHNTAPVPVSPNQGQGQGHISTAVLSGVDWKNFHPNSFSGATPHEAVHSMFTDVLEKGNHIQVHGLTDAKIDAITKDMQAHHWHIASGMENNGHGGTRQHIVDVAKDWADGRTSNADASRLQGLREVNGSSVQSWRQFVRVAAKHGVTITQERGAA